MSDTAPDDWLMLGPWRVRRGSIDAIGPDERDASLTVIVLRSGRTLTVTRAEAADIYRELDGDWKSGG